MPRVTACPFWSWEKDLALYCEGGKVRLPDKRAKREYIERYCASMTCWKKCSIARSLLEFYERSI